MSRRKNKWWKKHGKLLEEGSSPSSDGYLGNYGEVQSALEKMEAKASSAATGNVTPLSNGYVPTQGGKGGKWAGKGFNGWSQCAHNGLKVLAKIGDSTISIGGVYALASVHTIDLLVQCAAGRVHSAQDDVVLPERYATLRQYVRGGPKDTIVIDWPDGGLPPVQPEFWGALEALLPPGRVVFACVGGHGRSGTAAAAMIIQHFKTSARYAMQLIRQGHCDEAVETNGQEKYLTYFAQWLADKEGWRAKLDAEEARGAARDAKDSKATILPKQIASTPESRGEFVQSPTSATSIKTGEAYYMDGSPREDDTVAVSDDGTVAGATLDNGVWQSVRMCRDCGVVVPKHQTCPTCWKSDIRDTTPLLKGE